MKFTCETKSTTATYQIFSRLEVTILTHSQAPRKGHAGRYSGNMIGKFMEKYDC